MRSLRSLAVFLLLSVTFSVSAEKIENTKENILPLVMIDRDSNEFLQGGTGFVIGKTKRYLVTAKHVGGKYLGKAGYLMMTIVGGSPCRLEKLWSHPVADVVVMRFACDHEKVMGLPAFSLASRLPLSADDLTLYGFKGERRDTKANKDCARFSEITLCPRHTRMHIVGVNVPMANISMSQEEEEERTLEVQRLIRSDLSREDLFFDRYIVANEERPERFPRLDGYSGGPLADNRGNVYGIYSGNSSIRNAFVPVDVIPKDLIE